MQRMTRRQAESVSVGERDEALEAGARSSRGRAIETFRRPPGLRRATLLLALLAAGLARLPGAAAADEVTEAQIREALASPDSTIRYGVWSKLNPENATHYKYLEYVLSKQYWYDRDGAILSLSKAADPATVKKMTTSLKRHKDLAVRQGMAVALAKMNDERFYALLYDALNDSSDVVRRTVAHSLRVHKKPEAVEALVTRFEKEKDPVVKSFLVDALNEITQAFQPPQPTAWRTWWELAKNDKSYTLGKTDDEAKKKAEDLGNRLKERTTITTGLTLKTVERGQKGVRSVPILVLPYYNISKETMLPFLSELEETNRLFYIDLPTIDSFQGLEVVSDARIPYYPIDQLVEAFEKLRTDTGEERFAIMACGMNTWIAMRYAAKFPQSVSHLVLINPLSSMDAYGAATRRMEGEGRGRNDRELWHLSMTRLFNSKTGKSSHDAYHEEKKEPVPEGEGEALDRRSWALYFQDERDSMISTLYGVKSRPLGNVAIPNFKCFGEKLTAPIPTIVIVGKDFLMASVDDCKAVAKHFGGQLYVYSKSAGMPFAEESSLFNKHMAALLRERVRAPKSKKS